MKQDTPFIAFLSNPNPCSVKEVIVGITNIIAWDKQKLIKRIPQTQSQTSYPVLDEDDVIKDT